MNEYTRDNIILIVLILSVISWSVIGIGLMIAFGATLNPIFLLIAAVFFLAALLAGRAYNAYVVAVSAKPLPRQARSHRRHANR